MNPFKVEIVMNGIDPNLEFKTIDHRDALDGGQPVSGNNRTDGGILYERVMSSF
jgi:hypothetical protein